MPFAEVYTGWKRALSTLRNTRSTSSGQQIFRSTEVPFSDAPRLFATSVVINKAKFDGLTPEFQQALIHLRRKRVTTSANWLPKISKNHRRHERSGRGSHHRSRPQSLSDALGNQVRDMFVKDVPQGLIC